MNLYTRARKHIDIRRVKELHEAKTLVKKLIEHRQQIIDELDEINRQDNHVDWKEEMALSEAMTTGGLAQSYLPAEGDVALDTVSNVTVSDADNLDDYQDYPPPDYAITAQDQSLGTIDATKYDTLKLTISGSFNTRTVDGSELSDGIWIGILINGSYAGNYLAQDLRAGTHVIPIPARFQKPNMKFGAIKVYAIQGVSTPTSITNIQLQRRTPKTVFVALDDPEASAFVRGGLGGSQERKAKLKDMLDASNELMAKMGLTPSKTSPGDIQLASADALNTPGGVQGTRGNYTYDDHMKTWVPNISDVERKAAGGRSKYRLDNPLK